MNNNCISLINCITHRSTVIRVANKTDTYSTKNFHGQIYSTWSTQVSHQCHLLRKCDTLFSFSRSQKGKFEDETLSLSVIFSMSWIYKNEAWVLWNWFFLEFLSSLNRLKSHFRIKKNNKNDVKFFFLHNNIYTTLKKISPAYFVSKYFFFP